MSASRRSGGVWRGKLLQVLEVYWRAGRGGEGIHHFEKSLLLGFLRNESFLGWSEPLALEFS